MSLSLRTLNRTLLTRQLLLARQELAVPAAVEHLVGLQAQTTGPPYLALWSRLSGFAFDDLVNAIVDRTLVRMTLMRGTLHLTTPADAALLRPVVQPMLTKGLLTVHPELAGLDVAELVKAAKDVLADGPLPLADIGARLQERWPDMSERALYFGAQLLTPMVRVPPSGLWGRSATSMNASAAQWLGADLPEEPHVGKVVERYLRAFGPASAADVAAWSKVTGLRPHITALDLVRYRDPNGRELLDVPDGVLTEEDVPAPVRYLGVYDNALLSHADRTRIIAEEHRKVWGSSKNGVFPQTFLVDGFVRGTWVAEGGALTLTPYAKVSKKDVKSLEREGLALLKVLAPGQPHSVTLLPL